MEKQYYVRVDKYNYFGGASKTETKTFERIVDALSFQKESASHDFDYDDAWQHTGKVCARWNTTPKKTNVHKGKGFLVAIDPVKAAELAFDDDETEHLMSVVNWGDVPFT